MGNVSTYLENRSKAKGFERALFSEDGFTIAAMLATGTSHFNSFHKNQLFSNWKEKFESGYENLMDDFRERSIPKLNDIKSLIDNGDLSEARKLNSNLRSIDNEYRWRFEKFFAEEGKEGATNVLGYYSYDKTSAGYTSSYINYTSEQLAQLKETGKVTIDGSPLAPHHINSVSRGIAEPHLLNKIHHPNNIKLMTGPGQLDNNAHMLDPTHGHGGAFQNPTSGEARELSTRKHNIINENRDLKDDDLNSFDLSTSIIVGSAVGVITLCIQAYKLKDDPRTWKKKGLLIAASGGARAIEAGTESVS